MCFSFEEARALNHGKLQQCFSIILITQKKRKGQKKKAHNGSWAKTKEYILLKLGDILITVHEKTLDKNKSISEAGLHININKCLCS